MMESTLALASEQMQGRLRGSDGGFRGISTDSRTIRARELFFALQGPHFDGSRFVPQAAAAGAAGAVTSKPVDAALPLIEVEDTRRALGLMAAAWRAQMSATVIALTGSNGKTTCKELIAGCLSLAAPTLATRGNLNNDIGVPLMLADLTPRHRFAVIEMGANHHGEIAWLKSLVQPEIAVITNAGPAHLEGFGSIRGVARAKGEILQGEPRPRCAVLNADDAFFDYWKWLAADLRVVSFGLGAGADVRAVDVEITDSGTACTLVTAEHRLEVSIPLVGRHNAQLAAAAAAAALAAGVDPATIVRGLQSARPVSGRLNALGGVGGSRVYDDSYNANPASVLAAAEFVASRPGEAWLVLGDMGELGGDAEVLHRQVGEGVAAAGVARLFAIGPLSRHSVTAFGAGGAWFESIDELVPALTHELQAAKEVNVLVKGSRASAMERVVHALAAEPAGTGAD
jgi:UDP-N-acetylmuramoyl-tripeptide--D-alanyl-D-alanine ligase